MADPFRDEKISNWAEEFAASDRAAAFPAFFREHGAYLASAFLRAACRSRDIEPEALTEPDLKRGLFDGAGPVVMPRPARAKAAEYCAAFVETLQNQGRMAAAKSLPPFLRALGASFRARSAPPAGQTGYAAHAGGAGHVGRAEHKNPDAPKEKPYVRPGAKLGPNDPCPCGSGKKFKKCCQRMGG